MDTFEYLFSLIGLLLGFVLVEVLSGFVRAIKAGRPHRQGDESSVRVGWLTLMLAIFVMVDVASYWSNVWETRDTLTMGMDVAFVALFVIGLYYFAASMVFPDDLGDWADLDEWFWMNKRRVLLCVAVANGVGMTAVALFSPERPSLIEISVVQGVYFTALLIAALSRGPRLFAGSIGFLLLGYAAQGLIYAIDRVD